MTVRLANKSEVKFKIEAPIYYVSFVHHANQDAPDSSIMFAIS